MMAHSAMWREAVLLLALAPLGYYALATLAALRFFGRERTRQLPNYTPPVSVLKPVLGVDFGSHETFASFCRQEYPEYEILFAVNDDGDAAVPMVRQIIAEYPPARGRGALRRKPQGKQACAARPGSAKRSAGIDRWRRARGTALFA